MAISASYAVNNIGGGTRKVYLRQCYLLHNLHLLPDCNKLYIGETRRLISEDWISFYCSGKISIKQAEKKNRNPPIPS